MVFLLVLKVTVLLGKRAVLSGVEKAGMSGINPVKGEKLKSVLLYHSVVIKTVLLCISQ